MREIKFRAWDSANKRMMKDTKKTCITFRVLEGKVYVCHIGGIFNENIPLWISNDDIFPMQYTGIKDSKGNEIYEGDIIKWSFEDKEFPAAAEHGVSEVQYREFSAAFQLVNNNRIQDFWDDPSLWKYEIIGNAYENPELLKV